MFRRKKFKLRLPSRTLVLGERTLVMGVLNVTPDSFSDGGLFLDAECGRRARARNGTRRRGHHRHRRRIDAAGLRRHSGRRGTAADSPVLEELRGKLKIPISDRHRASREVAEAAADRGRRNPERRHRPARRSAHRGCRAAAQAAADPDAHARRAAHDAESGRSRATWCATSPQACAARSRWRAAPASPKSQIVLDPGIGFGKS